MLLLLLWGNTLLATLQSATHTYILSPSEQTLLIVDRKSGEEKVLKFDTYLTSMIIHRNYGYIISYNGSCVYKIDLDTHTIAQTTRVGLHPTSIVGYHDTLYIVCSGEHELQTIGHYSGTVMTRLTVGQQPRSVVLCDNFLYVTSCCSGDVTVIDARYDTIIKVIPVGKYPTSMWFHNHLGYVDNGLSKDISVIDLKSNEVVETIHHGESLSHVSVHYPFAYLISDSGVIKVMNLENHKLHKTLQVGLHPGRMVVCGDYGYVGTYCYLGIYEPKTVSVIDLTTHQVVDTYKNLDALPVNCTDTHIYLGIKKLAKRPEFTIASLFCGQEVSLIGDMIYGDPEAAFQNFEVARDASKMDEAKAHFAVALAHKHPKACAVAAYAYTRQKWGAADTGSLWAYYFSLADKTYFSQLCKEFE